jgi:hypothetical protein
MLFRAGDPAAVRTGIGAILPGNRAVAGAQGARFASGDFATTAFGIDAVDLVMFACQDFGLPRVTLTPVRRHRRRGKRQQRSGTGKSEDQLGLHGSLSRRRRGLSVRRPGYGASPLNRA